MSLVSTIKFGLPFLSFVVLGSFVLREFAKIRYEASNFKKRYGKKDTNSEYKGLNWLLEKDKNEDEDIKKFIENTSKQEWKNIRGPRPWEENKEYQELRTKLIEKKEKSKTHK